MPTYEYRCPDGHDFEQFVLKMSQGSTELPCPTCGKPSERRISAGGGLVFKGSGFYITDYGKDGKKDQRAGAKAAAAVADSSAKPDSTLKESSSKESSSKESSSKESSSKESSSKDTASKDAPKTAAATLAAPPTPKKSGGAE